MRHFWERLAADRGGLAACVAEKAHGDAESLVAKRAKMLGTPTLPSREGRPAKPFGWGVKTKIHLLLVAMLSPGEDIPPRPCGPTRP